MKSKDFWDNIFEKGQSEYYSKIDLPKPDDPILKKAVGHFGNLKNKTLIDLGCGNGSSSLYFASLGANVISIDYSDIAIKNLSEYCIDHDIKNITPIKLSAQEITSLDKVDFVYGSMILHHIEPFDEFASKLRDVIKKDGKAFFYENNARSKLMIWFRENIVGKLWVPKYGDEEEFPLTPMEVDELRKYFNIKIEIPELLFFRMISVYLLRGFFKYPFEILDDYFYNYPSIRKYSYVQYLFFN
tara:strand:- start:178 stop:906 length:729 start_codon:yes stop_codon:yes gene_type:complete